MLLLARPLADAKEVSVADGLQAEGKEEKHKKEHMWQPKFLSSWEPVQRDSLAASSVPAGIVCIA